MVLAFNLTRTNTQILNRDFQTRAVLPKIYKGVHRAGLSDISVRDAASASGAALPQDIQTVK
jgi:hypothetical protein